MVQGFSLGGEVGPTTAYLLESAPLYRRGYIVAWQAASQAIAATLAGLVGLILAATLSTAALGDYGWRVAFLLGAVTLPVGIWMRRGLPETLHEPEHHVVARSSATNVLAAIRENARIIVLGLLVLASGTIGTCLFNYLTTFAQSTLKLTPTVAFAGTLAQNLIGLVAVLFGGWLSDRIGRRPVMIYPRFLFLVLLLPVFVWMVDSRSAFALIAGSSLLSLLGSISGGALYAALTESLPKRIRSGAFATIYAFSIAVFGGTTQLIATWLIHVTGNPLAPAYYWFVAAMIGMGAALAIIESAPVRVVPRVQVAR
jgi:MFS family permease